jgi:hypothetical protein
MVAKPVLFFGLKEIKMCLKNCVLYQRRHKTIRGPRQNLKYNFATCYIFLFCHAILLGIEKLFWVKQNYCINFGGPFIVIQSSFSDKFWNSGVPKNGGNRQMYTLPMGVDGSLLYL